MLLGTIIQSRMSKTKRQDLPASGLPLNDNSGAAGGILSVVATPIGNLEDLSPRAKRTLMEAGLILCEDTRQAAKLFNAVGLGIPMARLERMDAHSDLHQMQRWMRRIAQGERIALITDAGTPAISDPGALLVQLALKAGAQVVPVPGPCAVPALISVSGFGETAFTFRGFFPRKKADQRLELKSAFDSDLSRVFVWFESPQRIGDALRLISSEYPQTEMIAAKELTKVYEHLFSGSAREVCAQVERELKTEGALGEWVFGVRFGPRPQPAESAQLLPESEVWVKSLQCLHDAGVSASEAAKQVSQHFGAPKKMVYDLALKIFGKKSDGGG